MMDYGIASILGRTSCPARDIFDHFWTFQIKKSIRISKKNILNFIWYVIVSLPAPHIHTFAWRIRAVRELVPAVGIAEGIGGLPLAEIRTVVAE